ncbi:hypothetical protein KIPE111705_06045 [Kibdelosporangium persicum]|uniref:SUKH-4 immunity protein of toxin-antitoxin system n=1 Tax=Kibdelosporangium persicum TaxID=2698649 RepID=A0ABX2F411_9PSEU|nr:hypothetical protein [Kibdelosporangium persicum]
MYSPVPELNELAALQERTGSHFLSRGFELVEYGDRMSFEALGLTDPEFLSRLIIFAMANGSGSNYALWRVDDRDDLAALPIIALGDEGGEHVVARDLPELFRLLTCDVDPLIGHDEVSYEAYGDHEPSGGHEAFVDWVRTRFGLEPTTDPAAVVTAAQREYGARFDVWVKPFLEPLGYC